MKTIVFTGGGSAGHVTPNLAIMAKLKKQGWDIRYIGSAAGIEKEIIEREGIPFYPISSGKLRRYFDLKNFKDPFKVIKGVYDAYRLLRKIKPAIVFSKGGFVSVPVVMGSKFNKIPVIIHESDMTPGLANKLSMPFATKICVTFPETLRQLEESKSVLTGLPIREGILHGNGAKGRLLCEFHSQKPVLMVMGGSLGSQAINLAVRESLVRLGNQFQIIHICGKGHIDADLLNHRGYKQLEYVSEELPDLMAIADVVISRAGSTSIYEFLALRKPMLLIPLSKQASRGDQILNAESFQQSGYADVLHEEELTAAILTDRIEVLYNNRETYQSAMAIRQASNAVDTVVRLIVQHSLST
jgi:UDP-N-acetylglucosamine--N-acetylmuramyl-(pentapeptide) pyrophosphoryl-undecaprenol N-acetylglucosamine transferase